MPANQKNHMSVERFSNLPIYAQDYITALVRERDEARRKYEQIAIERQAECTGTNVTWQFLVGEEEYSIPDGAAIKMYQDREYSPIKCIKIERMQDGKIQIHAYDDIIIEPYGSNCLYIQLKSDFNR